MTIAPVISFVMFITERLDIAWDIFWIFLISGLLLVIIDRISTLKISKDAIEIEAIKEKAMDYTKEIEGAYQKIQNIESELVTTKQKSVEIFDSLEKLRLKFDPALSQGFHINENYYGWVIVLKSPSNSLSTNIKARIIFNEEVIFVNNVSWGEPTFEDPIGNLKENLPEIIKNNDEYRHSNKIKLLDHIYPQKPNEEIILAFISPNKISAPTVAPTPL